MLKLLRHSFGKAGFSKKFGGKQCSAKNFFMTPMYPMLPNIFFAFVLWNVCQIISMAVAMETPPPPQRVAIPRVLPCFIMA